MQRSTVKSVNGQSSAALSWSKTLMQLKNRGVQSFSSLNSSRNSSLTFWSVFSFVFSLSMLLNPRVGLHAAFRDCAEETSVNCWCL